MRSLMQLAINEAKKAFLVSEVPIGSIIIHSKTGNVISKAHNEVIRRNNTIYHAEILAINRACALLGTQYLSGCDMYVTLEPCPMCAQAISFSRLRRLYFGAYNIKYGGVDHGPRIFHSTSCFHKPEIIGGIQEKSCSAIMKKFFFNKRKNFY